MSIPAIKENFPNLPRNLTILGVVSLITGLALSFINNNDYLHSGIGCLATGGGLAILALYLRHNYQSQKQKIERPRPFTPTPTEEIPAQNTSPVRTLQQTQPLLPPELRLPNPLNPIPDWLPSTFGYPYHFVHDPLALETLNTHEKELISRRKELPLKFAEAERVLLLKDPHLYTSLSSRLKSSDPVPSTWKHSIPENRPLATETTCTYYLAQSNNRADQHILSHIFYLDELFQSTAFGKRFQHILYQSQDAHLTLSSSEHLERCMPNVSALEKLAVHYRHGYHVPLFVIEKKDFHNRLLHEMTTRAFSSSPPYFGCLVLEETPDGGFSSVPLLFYTRTNPDNSKKKQFQCCIMQRMNSIENSFQDLFHETLIFNKDLKIERSSVMYMINNEGAQDDPTEKLSKLAHILSQLHAQTNYRSLNDILSPKPNGVGEGFFHKGNYHHGYYQTCHMPSELAIFEEFPHFQFYEKNNLSLPSRLQSESLHNCRDLLARYRRDVPYQLTFTRTITNRSSQNAWLQCFFADEEWNTPTEVPEGVNIQWNKASQTLQITISYRRPHNRYSYELAKACQLNS